MFKRFINWLFNGKLDVNIHIPTEIYIRVHVDGLQIHKNQSESDNREAGPCKDIIDTTEKVQEINIKGIIPGDIKLPEVEFGSER